MTVKDMTAMFFKRTRFCWYPKNKANDKYAYFLWIIGQQTIRRKLVLCWRWSYTSSSIRAFFSREDDATEVVIVSECAFSERAASR